MDPRIENKEEFIFSPSLSPSQAGNPHSPDSIERTTENQIRVREVLSGMRQRQGGEIASLVLMFMPCSFLVNYTRSMYSSYFH